MLTPLKKEDFDEYINFAYALALDPARSGYPTYADGIKTKADFVDRSRAAFERENEGILLYEREGRTAGWIHYYYLPEDKYLSTCSFCIAEGMGDAVGEFTAFARERFPGSELCLGFPGENAQAVAALEADGTEAMVFFNDNEGQADALALGFRCVGEYMCYQKTL